MSVQPVTVFFDVNETLSDLSTVADAFERVGAGRALAATWFASVLRDGFALTVAGNDATIGVLATNNARDLLGSADLDRSLEDAVDTVMTAFESVGLHPDVVDSLRALHGAGHRLITLSNGPTRIAERLLRDAGVLDTIDALLTVEEHTPWKPARDAYLDAVSRTGTEGTAYLVAVHPWDIHGASTAGLFTVWVNRQGGSYPEHFHPPTITVGALTELAHLDLTHLPYWAAAEISDSGPSLK